MGILARRGLTAAVLLAVCLSAAACAPTRSFDTDAAYAWANTQFHAELARGSLGLAVVGTDRTSSSAETGLSFAASTVTDLRVRCYGGAMIQIDARITGGTDHAALRGLVPCDRKDHLIPLAPASRFPATSVTLYAISRAETAALVIVEGAAAPGDVWDGYFDNELGRIPASAAYSGSFAASGVFQSSDASVPAGHHRVTVTCAGEATVTVTLAGLDEIRNGGSVDASPALTTDIVCPVTALLELTTDRSGISMRLDSHGTPGAFLVRVDPGYHPLGP